MLRKVSVYTLILVISCTIGGLNHHNTNGIVHAVTEMNAVDLDNEQVNAPLEKMIDGETFIKIEENEQIQSFIDIANKYEANVYGLPNTDIILIVKGENILLSSSTGSVATKKEHSEVLIDFFATEKNNELIEDIQIVEKTGEDIDKINDDFTGYYIRFDGEWIAVEY